MTQQQVIASGNSQEHSATVGSTGTGHEGVPSQFDIGAFNTVGVNHAKAAVMQQKSELNSTTTETNTSSSAQAGQQEQGTAARQLTEKDERHFTKFVSQAAEEKYTLARLAIESNEEAIYKIAETDKDLAARLLKEYDYGTTDVNELVEKQSVVNSKNPEEAQRQLSESKWKAEIEKELMEERILRLKGENPELTGDVEEKFRELYTDTAMKRFDINQKLAMAKAVAGKTTTKTSASDVALEMLKSQEGAVSSSRSSTTMEKTRSRSPEFKQMQKSMGVSDKDLELLPDNIEDIISQSLGVSLQ